MPADLGCIRQSDNVSDIACWYIAESIAARDKFHTRHLANCMRQLVDHAQHQLLLLAVLEDLAAM